jgi:hypothetical protein
MKKIFIIFIFLFAAGVLAATDPETDQGQVIIEEKVNSVPAAREEVQVKSPRDESWPRPFVPSEKIGADSVVSFPSDI